MDSIPADAISKPCSSPHCMLSYFVLLLYNTTLLKLNPRITGFEIAGPVFITESPGILSIALVMLWDLVKFKSAIDCFSIFNTLFNLFSIKGVDTITSFKSIPYIESFDCECKCVFAIIKREAKNPIRFLFIF